MTDPNLRLVAQTALSLAQSAVEQLGDLLNMIDGPIPAPIGTPPAGERLASPDPAIVFEWAADAGELSLVCSVCGNVVTSWEAVPPLGTRDTTLPPREAIAGEAAAAAAYHCSFGPSPCTDHPTPTPYRVENLGTGVYMLASQIGAPA